MSKIQGREALKRKFQAMPKAVRDSVQEALRTSADELTGMQKRLVPVGKTGKLQASIGWTEGDDPKGAIASSSSGEQADYKITVYAGNEEAFYAGFVEWGTKPSSKGERVKDASGRSRKSARTHPGSNARPFFFVSYRALKKRIKSRLSRAFTKGIKKAAGKS